MEVTWVSVGKSMKNYGGKLSKQYKYIDTSITKKSILDIAIFATIFSNVFFKRKCVCLIRMSCELL